MKFMVFNKNGDVALEEDFNDNSFFELPYVHYGMKLKLYKMPLEAQENTKDGFKRRLKLKVDEKTKEQILTSDKLSENVKFVLRLLNKFEIKLTDEKDIKRFLKTIEKENCDSFRDLLDCLVAVDYDDISKIIIRRIIKDSED